TATFASPPPNVASKAGDWKKRSFPGVFSRSIISPKVTYSAIPASPGSGDATGLRRQVGDGGVFPGRDGRGGREPASPAGDDLRQRQPIREVGRRHAAGRHEAHLAERCGERLERRDAARRAGREELHGAEPEVVGALKLGRGHDTRECGQVALA